MWDQVEDASSPSQDDRYAPLDSMMKSHGGQKLKLMTWTPKNKAFPQSEEYNGNQMQSNYIHASQKYKKAP